MTTDTATLNHKLENDAKETINKLALQVVHAARAQDNHSFLNSSTSMHITAAWDDDNDVPMHLTGFPVDGSPARFNVNFSEDGKHVTGVHYQDDESISDEEAIELLQILQIEASNISNFEPDFS